MLHSITVLTMGLMVCLTIVVVIVVICRSISTSEGTYVSRRQRKLNHIEQMAHIRIDELKAEAIKQETINRSIYGQPSQAAGELVSKKEGEGDHE